MSRFKILLNFVEPEQLNSWFEILHRIRILMLDGTDSYYAKVPLRKDIKDCIDCGWLVCEKVSTPPSIKLSLTEEGVKFYEAMADHLHSMGREVSGYKTT